MEKTSEEKIVELVKPWQMKTSVLVLNYLAMTAYSYMMLKGANFMGGALASIPAFMAILYAHTSRRERPRPLMRFGVLGLNYLAAVFFVALYSWAILLSIEESDFGMFVTVTLIVILVALIMPPVVAIIYAHKNKRRWSVVGIEISAKNSRRDSEE